MSGHGLGHASRSIEALDAIGTQRPDVRLLVRTSAPRWIFEQSARVAIDVHACETDVGMVQLDALRIDETATAARAAAFYERFDARVEREAAWLREARADLVVADIPPLAFPAAARAGIPSIAFGNFTWDWIYEDNPVMAASARGVVPRVREAYGAATRALRLPFHGGFAPMAGRVRDIPLVVRRSTRDPADTRRLLGLERGRPAVLASFGAYGAALPYARALADRRLTVLTTGRDSEDTTPPPPGLVRLDLTALAAHGVRYEDVIAAADVILSKPGYGIVSECAAHGVPLLYATRGHFREQDVFVEEMPRTLRARVIDHVDLLHGRWADAVEAVLDQPAPAEHLATDGADAAAGEILKELRN